ncbi:MAG: anaerobic glycerol-3-phosphate dehydrogenase subunit B [Anaerolineae bacterium]|nr:anaerobic glycerol-3-phosphate dehydrogenase subunit B [Anaerolineae bacterium]
MSKPTHAHAYAYHELTGRLRALEHGELPGELICECEIITRAQIEAALASYDTPPSINDLRRDLRIGMGPCQGGFCAFRTAAIRHEVCGTPPEETVEALREFAQRRFGGVRPLLWGHNLRQAELDEIIARRVMGRVVRPRDLETAGRPSPVPWPPQKVQGLPDGAGKRVVVVGAGLAGLTAALAAARCGARVHLVAAGIGKTHISPGFMELLDTHDPLDAALQAFVDRREDDPYTLAGPDAVYAGLGLVCEAAAAHGVPYYMAEQTNLLVATLPGLTRRAALVPAALAAGALTAGAGETLVVGFKGWRDFYPTVTADNLSMQGFPARALYIDLPAHERGNFDEWPVDLARRFERPGFRADVIQQVAHALKGAVRAAFPAVLGFYDHVRVLQVLQTALGVPVFEIPTLPPSVPGMRLYHALCEELLSLGARVAIGPRVTRGVVEGGRVTGVAIATASTRERIIRGDAVILATGGLLGGGLESDHRGNVWETIFDLPLVGPVGDRAQWFLPELFPAEARHPVHRIGVQADARMRPAAGENGAPAGLYVCGRLLGGYDPLREGSGEGVDIATGYKAAVSAIEDTL